MCTTSSAAPSFGREMQSQPAKTYCSKKLSTSSGLNIDLAAYTSPFSMVHDLQVWATSITLNTVCPPSTLVSPDGMQITHNGETFSVPKYRDGLQRAIVDLTAELDGLLYNFDVKLNMPAVLTDDWTNETRGYSFVNNHKFILHDSFFSHLLHQKEAELTRTDADGVLHFSLPSINRLLQRNTKFLTKLGPFLASGCSVACIAEFFDAKIKNTMRGCTIFMHLQDLWIDDKTTQLYDEYLWVSNRSRMGTKYFSHCLLNFTTKYCGVGLMTQDHRHMQVEMFHIFLNSTTELDAEESDLMDEQCGPSQRMAMLIYSHEYGSLAMLTSDEML
ncbi:hypothetical protein DFH06DRAFT_1338743 [Mycena polygramma]|nr:hypothetical protein DFH06DRAFT_1338743 [Mycena polygramma]